MVGKISVVKPAGPFLATAARTPVVGSKQRDPDPKDNSLVRKVTTTLVRKVTNSLVWKVAATRQGLFL